MDSLFRNRRTRIFLALLSLFFLIDMIQDSYAKYISSAEASTSFTIAEWAFKINNQDVIANSNFSSTLTPQFETNSNIKSGYIAPTSVGYFDVVIDSSDVGVAYQESITIVPDNVNTVSDLVVTGYKVNNGNLISYNGASPLVINHTLNEQVTLNTYRFYIEWIDGNGETMNNESDTTASTLGTTSITINVQFIQVAS